METSAISGELRAVTLETSVTLNTFLSRRVKTESPGSPDQCILTSALFFNVRSNEEDIIMASQTTFKYVWVILLGPESVFSYFQSWCRSARTSVLWCDLYWTSYASLTA